MQFRHGSLESLILNALWGLEGQGTYTNSVKDVYEILANKDGEKRAYTTIKTVMDRLYEKNVLLRSKQGNKFFYRTAYSNKQMVDSALLELANRYCNGDLCRLSEMLNSFAKEQKAVNI